MKSGRKELFNIASPTVLEISNFKCYKNRSYPKRVDKSEVIEAEQCTDLITRFKK